ncbi:MAG TPA: LamG-like jellyroll fold domain-containing protein [Bryobacteraceae bacterium]|nr:LamG-like jellyroll fold domain-containing protein [Bryobacteraceae bacterium]
MALQFQSTAAKVNHGSGASIDGATAWTVCMWVRPAAVSGNGQFMHKQQDGLGHSLYRDGAQIGGYTSCAGYSYDERISEDVLTAGQWSFVAWTYSFADKHRIYHGTLGSAPAETPYSITDNSGSGAPADDSAYPLEVGNYQDSYPFGGSIAGFQYFRRVLTPAEIRLVWMRPANAMLFQPALWSEYHGTGAQADWSGNGNAGTVSGGATVANHVPLGPPFGWDDATTWAVVSTGTTHALAGYVAGWSSSTATLKARLHLAGRAAGQSSQVGVFRARKVARATAAGNSSSSAVIRAIRGARATAAGASVGRGLVRLVRAARGVASGASSAAAVWRIRSALRGAASGVSWAVAIVHGAAGAIISLFGRTQGASSSVGTLRVARRTRATAAGAGSADAMLRIARKLAGKTVGSAFGQGVLRRMRAVGGIAQGSSTAHGKLALIRRLIGAAAGSGETAGRMAGRRVLRAVAAGKAGLRGVLTLIKANFRVSAERTIVVPYEDRIIACEAEQRLMTPPAENRIIQV